MKNIVKYAAMIMLLAGSVAVKAGDILKIVNDTNDWIYIALGITVKEDKRNKVFRNKVLAWSLSPYIKVPGTASRPLRLGIAQAVDFENFESSSSYDRTLWVSKSQENLAKAIKDGKITDSTVIAYEVGGLNKAVVVEASGSGFKFNSYKKALPTEVKLKSKKTIKTLDILTDNLKIQELPLYY